ncbi:hypothetical protein, partial [Vibrio sinaloensis]|uniref:hypothetical protein n=1 Tax=Photobacterium sp. (strain ATCC 43367) TaxID=379097 RepID=UPI0019D3A676
MATYFSRLEFAQKIVNVPQLIAIYIYPRMCVIDNFKIRDRYFTLAFLSCYVPIIICCYIASLNYQYII